MLVAYGFPFAGPNPYPGPNPMAGPMPGPMAGPMASPMAAPFPYPRPEPNCCGIGQAVSSIAVKHVHLIKYHTLLVFLVALYIYNPLP